MDKPKISRRTRAKAATTAPVEAVPVEGKVRVRCVVDFKPWHSGGFLTLDEEAEIPAADAEIMIILGQVKPIK